MQVLWELLDKAQSLDVLIGSSSSENMSTKCSMETMGYVRDLGLYQLDCDTPIVVPFLTGLVLQKQWNSGLRHITPSYVRLDTP